jgi:hypothetical protein
MSRSLAIRPSSASLALLLGTCGVAGCLVPAPIDEETVPPNYPPVFAPETVTPAFEQEITYDPAVSTEPISFEIPDITDVDANDRVYWRWFINYDARFNDRIAAVGLDVGAKPIDGKTRISYSVSPCDDFAAFTGRTLHRVEVLVSDRPFLPDDENTVAGNQRLPADAGHFRIVWFIAVDPTACPVVP